MTVTETATASVQCQYVTQYVNKSSSVNMIVNTNIKLNVVVIANEKSPRRP